MSLLFTIAPPAPKQNAAGDARARIADPRLWQLKKTLRKECGLMTGDRPTTRQIVFLLSGVDTKCIMGGSLGGIGCENHTHLLVEYSCSCTGAEKEGQNVANKSLFRADLGHEVHEMLPRAATCGRSTQAITLSNRVHLVPTRRVPR